MNNLSELKNLHGNIAADVWPGGSWLHCPICDRWERISSAQCGYYLGHGWPKCCGHTMHTNDKPDAHSIGEG